MDDISGNPCDRERTLNCFVFTEEGKTLASINHPLAGLFGAESLFIVEISSLLSQEQSEELNSHWVKTHKNNGWISRIFYLSPAR